MQIPSISTLANQNRNSFKGFNNVLALRVTTDNGNSVKVFSCKLNNIGENDLNKNGRRVLLEVANNFQNSIAAAISSYRYRLIKTAMKSPY